MEVTKAIIATAGYGTRRLPITKTIEKNMLPLGNRPVIDYVIQECILAGITDIYLVVNDIATSQIKAYFDPAPNLEQYLSDRNATEKLAKLATAPDGITFHYVEQDINARYGTSVPITLAVEQYNINEPVAFCNGDDPFWGAKNNSDVKTLVDAFKDPDETIIMGYRVDKKDVPRYGMLKKDTHNMLISIIEKPSPEQVDSSLVNLNRLILSPGLLKVIVAYTNSHDFGPTDQEYMITDAYTEYLRQGGRMRVVPSTGQWLDCGSLEGWLHANNVVCGEQ
jgi:UTP--glucose-1-phosphate uridylyltransferase